MAESGCLKDVMAQNVGIEGDWFNALSIAEGVLACDARLHGFDRCWRSRRLNAALASADRRRRV